jgi:hypothetical protein
MESRDTGDFPGSWNTISREEFWKEQCNIRREAMAHYEVYSFHSQPSQQTIASWAVLFVHPQASSPNPIMGLISSLGFEFYNWTCRKNSGSVSTGQIQAPLYINFKSSNIDFIRNHSWFKKSYTVSNVGSHYDLQIVIVVARIRPLVSFYQNKLLELWIHSDILVGPLGGEIDQS